MKIPTKAPRIHVWEKRRANKETVRIEVELGAFSYTSPASFVIRVAWRPFRGRDWRFPGAEARHRQGKEEEYIAIIFAIVTREEIEEAIAEFVAKIGVALIPEPVTPPDLQEGGAE